MTATIARDSRTRPPMPPPKGVSVADNLPVAWVKRWTPETNYGVVAHGTTLYRVGYVTGDDVCQTWELCKLIERPREPDEWAVPYTLTVATPGGAFVASCDCAAHKYSRATPRTCKHLGILATALESLEVHEITDDAVDRFEAAERLAKCGANQVA